ncbi:MAG TPA: hypothetical protein VF620_11740 [Allosphingosinicella sp.]
MAAADWSPGVGAKDGAARSVFVSPLLNLAPTNGTGPTVAHGGRILELRNSRIAGTARAILSPDRRTIDISVALDPPRRAAIHLRRLELSNGCNRDTGAENQLIVEVEPCRRSNGESCTSRRFSLDHRQAYAAFANMEELLMSGICLSGLGAESVSGIEVEPAVGRCPGGQGQREYFCERMLSEITAAECSSTPVAASRHVQLATLYARRLGDGICAL